MRTTKRARRRQWRSDWTPLWVSLLLFSVLLIFYTIVPSNDPVEHAEQAVNNDTMAKEGLMRGALGAQANR